MDRGAQPGFRFFPAGRAWERAFHGALGFLDHSENGVLLLGPGIGAGGRAWLEEHSLARRPLRFGSRTLGWNEWVQERARGCALAEGHAFRVLSEPAKREFFRATLAALEAAGSLQHLAALWKEERFFSAFLRCVEEARLAGLHEQDAVLRARELLAAGADPVSREAYDDFWKVLLAWEAKLGIEDGQHDQAALVRRAAESSAPCPDLFLLGFDHFSLLEVDLLQRLAAGSALSLPLALPLAQLARLAAGKEAEAEQKPAALLRALVTGFSGRISAEESPEDREGEPAGAPGAEALEESRHFLAAHAPSEEARAAAAMASYALGKGGEARFVLDGAFLRDESALTAFQEELGLPRGCFRSRPLERPLGRLFFHLFELKRRRYPLAHALELAELLQFTSGKFREVPSLAARAGIREGLHEWKTRSAGCPELAVFASLLDELDRLLPEKARPVVFADAVGRLAALCGIGELARRAEENEIERDAHATLAAMVRNAQLVAAGIPGELELAEWLREWRAVLAQGASGDGLSFFPAVQLYGYGEWLPPAGPETLTLVLGFSSAVGPGGGFSFFLEEGARRKLSELRLPTQAQEELAFFDRLQRLAREPRTIFSWSRHGATGGEEQPHWISAALPLVPGDWPELARPPGGAPFRAGSEARTPPPGLRAFSASLLELYKECPFKAFALKVLRLEDKMQAASLDISDLARGNIVHRTLELFYGSRRGKEIHEAAERGRVLDECLQEAVAGQKIEYFKGGERLLASQVRRLRAMLLEFLSADAANYAEFPFFGQPLVEKKVGGLLGGKHPWEGKADRVDVDEENSRFLVIDYKSGASTPSSSEVAKLERFQLQLYMDAIEAERPGFQAAGGLYVSLKTGDRKQGLVRKELNRSAKTKPDEVTYYRFAAQSKAPRPEEEFAAIRAATRAEAFRIAEAVEGGVFDPAPLSEESCQRCAARPACRVRELRAPERLPWPRRIPEERFRALLAGGPGARAGAEERERSFNEEQAEALARENQLVFIEASAGTGKTTVIVEKIRRFLSARIEGGEAPHRAVERFAAISFTDKSAQELGARLGATLIHRPAMGARVAAQAIRQVSTIHGFCRRLLSDFPVEAGVSPMAELMDERAAESLREDACDEFFLSPPEEAGPDLDLLLGAFPRLKLEGLLRKLLEQRLLLRGDLALYEAWLQGEAAAPGGLVPAGEERAVLGPLLRVSRAFQETYDRLKRERELLDFNDLESLALRVLGHEHCCAFYRERFELLLVDEFQDTNSVQREILERIARPGWSNLFVVGDAKQSIYRFRAADVSVFQELRREAGERGQLVTLSRNYRSRREVVEAANLVTRAVFPAPGDPAPSFEATAAESRAERAAGGAVTVVEYGDPAAKLTAEERRAAEAELLVRVVQEQLARGRRPGVIAVLMRKISGNGAFLQALTRAGIPFRVGSSRGFYSQQVILDAIALLRAVHGASNDMALLALLRSPWARLGDGALLALQKRGAAREPLWSLLSEGDAPLLFAWKRAAPFLSCSELLARAFAHYPLGRREHLQVVKLLAILGKMEEEGRTRVEAVERLSLWAGWESEEAGADDSTMPEPGDGGAVQLMTVHAAKGLEFDVTVLPDLGAGLQPDRSALRIVPGVGIALKLEDQEKPEAYAAVGERNRERELAESKRLLYVAVTRAREECVFLLPREAEGKKRGESWADLLRGSGLAEQAARVSGESLTLGAPLLERAAPDGAAAAGPPRRPSLRRESSITELAAYQFCPEFHRRKFVQAWDDRVVGLWPVEDTPRARLRAAARAAAGTAPAARAEAGRLLKALDLQRKERGIALHRVLERQRSPDLERERARLWLGEAYEAQGADPAHELFPELIEQDLALLGRFLGSELGRGIFSADAEAFPEIPFRWSVGGAVLHGAIDRLIRRPSGAWVVVDYKSSVLEESRERYRFQVASYMAAVAAHARAGGEAAPRVEGILVDLYEATAHPVEVDLGRAALAVAEELERSRGNYTLARSEALRRIAALPGGEHCLQCAYCLHCEIGLKVLSFK